MLPADCALSFFPEQEKCVGGRCPTSLLVCVSPSLDDAPESLGSLELGSRAMGVRVAPEQNRGTVFLDAEALAQDLAQTFRVSGLLKIYKLGSGFQPLRVSKSLRRTGAPSSCSACGESRTEVRGGGLVKEFGDKLFNINGERGTLCGGPSFWRRRRSGR